MTVDSDQYWIYCESVIFRDVVVTLCVKNTVSKYEQYLKPYEESEQGDSTKITLKAEELGVYIDDLNQTKQAEE